MSNYRYSFGSAQRRKAGIILYLVFLHLFAVVLIAKTDFIPKAMARLGIAEQFSPEDAAFYGRMLAEHRMMDASVPDGASIFLGDSIVQGLATTAVAARSVNFGIRSETTARLLDALPSYNSLRRAGLIVLAIGVNDVFTGQMSGIEERYRKILSALPPETPLIWSSVMPAKTAPWMKMKPSDIPEANLKIQSLCLARGNCIFLDTWRFLADEKSQPLTSLFLDDGIHLGAQGYARWIDALRQATPSSLR